MCQPFSPPTNAWRHAVFNLDIPTFVPRTLFSSGHVQTIASSFKPRSYRRLLLSLAPATTQWLVDLPDGDQLVLHDLRPTHWQMGDRQALLCPGLGGTHASPYLVRTAKHLFDSGIRVWKLDPRGWGAGFRLARHHHHAGRTADIESAVERIAAEGATSPITLIGFSLGAGLTLSWLCQSPPLHQRVDSAIAVAPPVDLEYCVRKLARGWGRIYDRYFGRMLQRTYQERRRQVPQLVDRPLTNPPDRLFAFDEQFTAPLGGFQDARDYYQQASCAPHLHQIDTPTLIIADQHDPVVPIEIFRDLELSRTTQYLATQCGGHLGYFGRKSNDPDEHWLDWRIREWVCGLPSTARHSDAN